MNKHKGVWVKIGKGESWLQSLLSYLRINLHYFIKPNYYHCDITYPVSLITMFLLDPGYQCNVPILDGGEGASEHVMYGTDFDQHPLFPKKKLATE